MQKSNIRTEVAALDWVQQRLSYLPPHIEFIQLSKPQSLLEPASVPTEFVDIEEGGNINPPSYGLAD